MLCTVCLQTEAQYVSEVWVSDQGNGTYRNPVLHADYSDPDVCAAGDDFYMTASSRCGMRTDRVIWYMPGPAVARR